jgi:hypothetical protein
VALVELDIFSGRPNPTWEVADGDAQALRAIQRDLDESTEPAPEPPGLGYRGFRYTLDGLEWRAFAGVVSSAAHRLTDPGHRVERFLLGTMPPEHDDDIRARVAPLVGS